MGVSGLWNIINRVGQTRSLASIAVIDGFEGNKSGRRAFRLGIDISIWYNHVAASNGKSNGGENPELRTIFFRLRSLALPFLPLFVFDGRERPKMKRGSKLGKSGSHALTSDVKRLLDAFGMEWRMALGEAEAELAHLNQAGIIDGIMTDDCDALIFGGCTIIKNPGLALTGNKSHPALNANGKHSKHHVMVYTADAVQNNPEVGLTREGLILFALLAGGDYNKGVERFGPNIAHALARCGFGELLLSGFAKRAQQDFRQFLVQWRTCVDNELRTNSHGFLRQRYPSLSLPAGFPDLKILENYVEPATSGKGGARGGGAIRDVGELNLAQLAGFCQEKFGDWDNIIKRCRSLLWPAAVMRVLRRAALEGDEYEKMKRIQAGTQDWSIRHPLKPSRAEAIGTPASLVKKYLGVDKMDRYSSVFANQGSHFTRTRAASDLSPLIVGIVGTRKHISTDRILEYRVVVSPSQLIDFASSGIKRKRDGPSRLAVGDESEILMHGESSQLGPTKLPPDAHNPLRIWIPACIMHQVHPDLVENFVAGKSSRKTRGKSEGNTTPMNEGGSDSEDSALAKLAKQGSAANTIPTQIHPNGARLSLDPDTSWRTPMVRQSRFQNERLGFLFRFTDPEDATVLDDGPPLQETPFEGPEYYDGGPPNRFDLLFDQIMGAPQTARARNSAQRRKRPCSSALDSIPDALFSSICEGNSKRRKTRQVQCSTSTDTYQPSHLTSEVLELSDPGVSRSGPVHKPAPSRVQRNTARRVARSRRHHPNMPDQDSRSASIIDLT